MAKTKSEKRFERYLSARGHTFEFEPDLGISFQPDYRVLVGRRPVICEVKEFKTNWLTERLAHSRIGSASARQPTQAVRNRVHRAIEQLADLAGHSLPLVVVLSNPHQADVDLDPERVWAALYHDGGPLAIGRADHISAIAILQRQTAAQDWAAENVRRHKSAIAALLAAVRAEEEGTVPESEHLFMTVLPTLSATAVPLPEALFNGPDDAVWQPR